MAGLLHELVAVAAASEYAGFDTAGTVCHFAGGDLRQQREAVGRQPVRRDVAAHHVGSGSEYILACAGGNRSRVGQE